MSEKGEEKGAKKSLACQRHLFDLPEKPVYLNGAARSPMMKGVYEVGCRAIAQKLQPWKISGGADTKVKAAVGELLGTDPLNIALTPSTSYSLSAVAANAFHIGQVKYSSDAVIILENQMSSNVLPWQHLCKETGARLLVAPMPSSPSPRKKKKKTAWADSVLSLDWKGVKVVAVPPAMWTDGSVVDLMRIRRECDKHGAWLVVDATQALGVVPLSVASLQPDFLCASVHKWLYGPYGACVLYIDPKHAPQLVSIDQHERNRVGAEKADLPFVIDSSKGESQSYENGYTMTYQSGASVLQAGGRPNPVLLPMLASSLQKVLEWGVGSIYQRCLELSSRIIKETPSMGYALPPAPHSPHIIGLRIPSVASDNHNSHGDGDSRCTAADCVKYLEEEKGILVSERLGVIRISPSIYNTREDVNLLLEALRSFAEENKLCSKST
eukprot:jgi/Bigna1/131978/aug1.16_g6686